MTGIFTVEMEDEDDTPIVTDIFAATDEEFTLVFPKGTDITFIDEVYARSNRKRLDAVFNKIWQRRVKKSEVQGIHGTIFYELEEKKVYYSSRRDEEAVNPDGSNSYGRYRKNKVTILSVEECDGSSTRATL